MSIDHPGCRDIQRDAHVPAATNANSARRAFVPTFVAFMRMLAVTGLAADTWLGPFYIAYGRPSGGQTSFYLYLGRP